MSTGTVRLVIAVHDRGLVENPSKIEVGSLSLNIPEDRMQQFDFLQKVFDQALLDLGWADRVVFTATGSVLTDDHLLDLDMGALGRKDGVYDSAWSRFYLTMPSLTVLSTGDWLVFIQKALTWLNPARRTPGCSQFHDMGPIEGTKRSESSILHVTLNEDNL